MGALDCCGKAILVIINIFFVLFGLIFLGVGVFLRVGADMILDQVEPLLEQLPDISSAVAIPGVTEPSFLNDDSIDAPFDLETIFVGLSTAFIVLGVLMLVIGLLGCIGGCCGLKVLLIIYAVVVGVLFLAKFIIVICMVTNTFDDQIKDYMNETLVDKYVGIDDLGLESVVWNFLMIQFKCCGVDDYTDFHYAKNWRRTREFEVAGATAGLYTQQTPVSCCKMEGDFPSVTPEDEECSRVPTDANSNWKTGCWGELKAELKDNNSYLIAAIVVVFIIEVACIVLAIIVVCRSGSSKTAPV